MFTNFEIIELYLCRVSFAFSLIRTDLFSNGLLDAIILKTLRLPSVEIASKTSVKALTWGTLVFNNTCIFISSETIWYALC